MMKWVLLLALVAGMLVQITFAEDLDETCEDDSSEEECEDYPKRKCTKPNEVYEICPPKCPFRTCGIDDNLIDCIPSPRPGDPNCPKPKCRCKPQFFRDDKGNCVPWKKCPVCTKPNEEYDPCDTPCPARRCDFDATVVRCKAPPEIGDEECVVGCRCKDGFLRDAKGVCIPKDKCPKKCKKNEYYDPCFNCGSDACDSLNQTINCPFQPSDPYDPRCNGTCRCLKGYARDNNGVCVPVGYCTKCNQPNEVYDPCPDCSPNTCESIGRIYDCPLIPYNTSNSRCKPACRCKTGFYKNKIGQCISAANCAKCTGEHEFWSCGSACDNVCGSKYGQDNCNIINIKCNEKCYCEKDYARARNGTCIPKKDCPQKTCKKNEFYDPCPDCNPQTCSTVNETFHCPLIPSDPSDPRCNGTCRCLKGYARDNNGDCVPVADCSKCTKPNEVFNPCPDCSPQTCESIGKIYHCPLIPANTSDARCKPSCRCKNGYFRNKIGECISSDDCAQCPGPHEYFSCGVACDNICGNKIGQDNCNIINIKCNEMCYCEKDYARASNGTCILKKDCPPKCPANETYEECPSDKCQPKSCSDAGFPLNCTTRQPSDPCPVKPGCICNDGFLRNQKGICVPSIQCPSCGGDKNSTLGCGVNCGRTCASYKRNDIACIAVCFPNSCDCRPKYVFDANIKECVLPKDCTPVCKENEVFSTCVNGGCQKKNCSDLNRPDVCVHPKECKVGCLCADGYLRAKNGTCVPIDQCDAIKCILQFEYYDPCPNCNPQTCSTYNESIPCPPPVCKGACRCLKGYARDYMGRCIPGEYCTKCKKPNEVYDACATCIARTCENRNVVYGCPNMPLNVSDPTCIAAAKCRCKDGYVLNKIRECILADDCAKCPGEHEYFSCGVACDNVCGNKFGQDNCNIINKKCNERCYCEKDFARNSSGVCIPKKDCPPIKCGVNEFYDSCPKCNPQTCSTLNVKFLCPLLPCKGACRCQEGFARNNNGKCVPVDYCNKCNNATEVYDPCPSCDPQTCETRYAAYSCPAIPADITDPRCKPACRCMNGYYRNKANVCVPAEKCDNCPPNERFEKCPASLCEPQKCSEAGLKLNCTTKNETNLCHGNAECVCESGYLRNDKGVCIPSKECPNKCGVNEFYDSCPNCNPQTCSTYNLTFPCPYSPCKGACRCQKGYARDNNGKCVPVAYCTKCNNETEVYDTCPGCGPQTCETRYAAYSCPAKCPKPACRCKDGYYRNKANKCVPEDKCDNCPPNERFEKCPATLCEPQKCSEAGFELNCTIRNETDRCPGKPGCVCESGYLRNEKGVCIPSNKCPSCGGDKNSTLGCGVNCGRLCSNYKEKNIACILICYPNACDCRENYVFDGNIGKCVLPKDCTPVCKANEVYSTCINGGCQKKKCSDLKKPDICVDPLYCKVGCLCAKGYLRADNGTCVPIDQCGTTCGVNEVYSDCANGLCRVQNCSDKGKKYPCPPMAPDACTPGCVCPEKFLRAKNGTCVPEDQCDTTPICPKGEILKTCPPPKCDGEYCPKTKDDPQTCPYPIDNKSTCNPPRCVCDFNSHRDRNTGKCIATTDCPPFPCGKNEEYYNCGPGCPGDTCNDYLTNATCPPYRIGIVVPCTLGCKCKKGYYRDYKNECIPASQCQKCPKNEHYVACPAGVCTPQNCSQAGFPVSCPKYSECPGKPGCICNEGYLRDSKEVCIPKNQCPSCGGDNNANPGCGVNCNNRCSNLNSTEPQFCTTICNDNGCDCKKGFVYDDKTGKCVNPKDCSKCPKGEILSSCPPPKCDGEYCPKTKDDPQTCPYPNNNLSNCSPPRCVCNFNSHRDRNTGKCIATTDCPPFPCGKNEEYYNCGAGCPGDTCNDYLTNATCPPYNIDVVVPCTVGCKCKEGYYRDYKNECIPASQCQKCPKNEHYVSCPAGVCTPQNCSQAGFPIPCPKYSQCPGKPGCICNEGYLRDSKGVCIPKNQCPSCGGDSNAKPGCGVNCNNRCSNYNSTEPEFCAAICDDNGCDCKKGFVYDDNTGKCVNPKNCTRKCGVNEVYTDCSNGLCRVQNCTDKGKKRPCPPMVPGSCIPGCVCPEKFLRAKNGTCVPEDQCDVSPTCPEEEVFNTCPPPICDAQYCPKTKNDPQTCPYPNNNSSNCADPRCVCGFNSHRDRKTGKCIATSQCPPFKCDAHEVFYSCGAGCPGDTCNDYLTNATCPKFRIGIVIPCTLGCKCEKGYYRNSQNVCVPANQCKNTTCPANERYVQCPDTMCQPLTCKQAGFPVACPVLGPDGQCPGKPRCICNDGYLRDDKGVCIPKTKCPSCGGDGNAIPGCGVNCNKRCTTVNSTEQQFCPLFCNLNGCDCKNGYYYDGNLDKCVLPEKCTPICQPTEVFANCSNAICRPQVCADKGKSISCIASVEPCEPGCICPEQYLRATNGTCIPEDDCDNDQCES